MVIGRMRTAVTLMNILILRCVSFDDGAPPSPPSYSVKDKNKMHNIEQGKMSKNCAHREWHDFYTTTKAE